MKSKVDKLDVDKLSPFHFYLKKLSEVVDNDVAKQTAYNKLGKNVSATQTSGTCNLTKKSGYKYWWKLKENTWSWSW